MGSRCTAWMLLACAVYFAAGERFARVTAAQMPARASVETMVADVQACLVLLPEACRYAYLEGIRTQGRLLAATRK